MAANNQYLEQMKDAITDLAESVKKQSAPPGNDSGVERVDALKIELGNTKRQLQESQVSWMRAELYTMFVHRWYHSSPV